MRQTNRPSPRLGSRGTGGGRVMAGLPQHYSKSSSTRTIVGSIEPLEHLYVMVDRANQAMLSVTVVHQSPTMRRTGRSSFSPNRSRTWDGAIFNASASAGTGAPWSPASSAAFLSSVGTSPG